MSRIIEAKARITGEDRLSGVLDRVNAKLKQVGKGAKVSADVERMNRALGNTARQLAAVEKVKATQDRLSSARLGLTGAQARVDQVAAKLAAARKMEDAAAVAKLAAEHKAAEGAVARATGAVALQTARLREARHELNAFGVPIANLAAHEQRLRESVEKTTAAIRKQSAAERDRMRFAEAKALKLQRRQEAQEREAERRDRANRRIPVGADRSRDVGMLPLVRGAAPYLAPLVVGAELKREVKTFADLEKAMTSLGVTAEASDAQVRGAMEQFRREGPALGVDPKEMARAAEMYVAAGLDFQTAVASAATTVRAAKASGGSLEDLASAGIASMQQCGFTAKGLERAFDLMAKGGKEGRFELRNMAKELPAVGAGAKRLGLESEKGLAKSVAALEVIRDVVGSPEEAANRWNNVVQKEFLQETQKNFKKFGVNLEQEIKDGAKKGIDALDVLLDATERVAKGDQFKLGKLFNDAQAMEGIQALTRHREKFKALTAKILAEANGTIANDFDRITKTTSENFAKLSASWDRATGRLGEALAPSANRLAEIINTTLDKIDRGETFLTKWEKERRARQVAEGRDPDAERRQWEADKAERDKQADAANEKTWGSKNGWIGWVFPEPEKIDEAVQAAREEGLKAKADRERALAERAAQARAKQLEAEVRRKGRPPVGSPLPKETVSAMDAEEADRLANLSREFGTMADRGQLAAMEARLARLEGPQLGDFGAIKRRKAFGKRVEMPEIAGTPAPLERDPTAAGPRFGLGPAEMGGLPAAASALERAAAQLDKAAAAAAAQDGRAREGRAIPEVPGASGTGPITARVDSPIPVSVSGEVSGQAQLSGSFTIEPSQWFVGRFNGLEEKVMQLSGRVTSMGSAIASNGPGSTGKSAPDAGKGSRD